MYDPQRRYCPKHPTLVHPCQICATPSSRINSASADNTVLDQVNWQEQAQTPYNTPMPRRLKHDPMAQLAEDYGLDSHWDNPKERKIPPPPRWG